MSLTVLAMDSLGSTTVTVAVSLDPVRSKAVPALVGVCPGVMNQAVSAVLVRATPALFDGTSRTVAV